MREVTPVVATSLSRPSRPAPPAAAVGGGQRRRILRGMVEAAAEHGYARASVARVIERAGVARGTFYAEFTDREECFGAAYRMEVRGLAEAIEAAVACPEGERDPIASVLDAVLRRFAADPAGARLLLVEAFAAPAAIREKHEERIEAFERRIESFLASRSRVEAPLQLSACALVGGVGDTIVGRLVQDEADTLPDMAADLIAWIDSYRLSPGCSPHPPQHWQRLGGRFPPQPRQVAAKPDLLPRGASALPAGQAASDRQARIVEATTRVVSARGYAGSTVADIGAEARVSKAAFYSHFESKLDAFLAAQRLNLEGSLAVSAGAFYGADVWPERVWGALIVFLRYIAERPQAADLAILEVHAAGETAIKLERDTRMAYTLFLKEGHLERLQWGPALPPLCSEAVAGAINGVLRRHLRTAGAERVTQLAPQCAYVTLAPFLGPERACEFIHRRLEAAP